MHQFLILNPILPSSIFANKDISIFRLHSKQIFFSAKPNIHKKDKTIKKQIDLLQQVTVSMKIQKSCSTFNRRQVYREHIEFYNFFFNLNKQWSYFVLLEIQKLIFGKPQKLHLGRILWGRVRSLREVRMKRTNFSDYMVEMAKNYFFSVFMSHLLTQYAHFLEYNHSKGRKFA